MNFIEAVFMENTIEGFVIEITEIERQLDILLEKSR
jgi:hypothetical protein